VEITCPNCHEPLQLVGAAELKDEYGLSSNSVQHYKTRGFPEPVLTFGNRHIYLRKDVDAFVANRSRSNIERAVETLMHDLDHLPDSEREEARKILEERLGTDGHVHTKPKTANGRRRKR
jgi:hypothetical protein